MALWSTNPARNYAVTPQEWENRVTWDSLSLCEQMSCCTGSCGIELFGVIKYTPDFVFRSACCRHDFGYLRGGDETVRKLVDRNFKEEIRKLAGNDEVTGEPRTSEKWWYKRWAELYADAVVRWGWMRFDYGPMKTKEQLLAAIAAGA